MSTTAPEAKRARVPLAAAATNAETFGAKTREEREAAYHADMERLYGPGGAAAIERIIAMAHPDWKKRTVSVS